MSFPAWSTELLEGEENDSSSFINRLLDNNEYDYCPSDPFHRVDPPLHQHTDLEIDGSIWQYLSDSESPTNELKLYDVFLSFRGEDTRASFTSHLHTSLLNSGIIVFRDDDSLRRGDQISTSLKKAIGGSRIAVVVFSKRYPDSKWCLQELERIMECYRTIGLKVLPVFYHVDPSQVRHQTGEFGNAFRNLLNRISTKKDEILWRMALSDAAGLAGIVVLNSSNESEAIKDIVDNVALLLDKTELFIADNPVGVESRVQDIIKLLEKFGRNFEGRSFLANIREIWEQDGGQMCLQEQLLFDILKETTPKIKNIDSGKSILKERLCHKRVLVVLDDVNKLDQLNALVGSCRWFASGSRIIITTRDKQILRGDRVDVVYTMKEMNESESIELFCWHAFKQASPKEDFAEISRAVVKYSGGLPLALEVLGSYLFDLGIVEWKCVLEQLEMIPNNQVQQKLRISYDGLNYDTEKQIFLDIACFFIGTDRNDVIHILNGCGLFAERGINVLVERSLVTVDDKNKIGMHDLLRDMGREIIRENFPHEPEERSRLWFHEDVLDVLSEHTGSVFFFPRFKFPKA